MRGKWLILLKIKEEGVGLFCGERSRKRRKEDRNGSMSWEGEFASRHIVFIVDDYRVTVCGESHGFLWTCTDTWTQLNHQLCRQALSLFISYTPSIRISMLLATFTFSSPFSFLASMCPTQAIINSIINSHPMKQHPSTPSSHIIRHDAPLFQS